MNTIKDIKPITLSSAWATLKRIDFDYRFKNGQWKRLSRETYDRGDGAAILLYNTQRQSVILTKQFRMPIYVNAPSESYSIEVCAGAIDNNEDPLETILREVEEETGYRIKSAQQVLAAYTSPGALTEKMFLFVAEYHDDLKKSSGGGCEDENEELEVIELSFEDAMTMIKEGSVRDAKTIMLLQYAKIEKLFE
jgi:nudix-type nucleoside diphosphatase (YffH/AdpP family)